MAAYSFNSEPRVVSTRSEKYLPEDKMTMNLMYDKRVFRGHVHDIHNIRPVLSPQEQEELHLRKEKERQQQEMMKKQLEAFKKNKNKPSPYDIRPAATGRIEVDLQYFLTDQKDIKPNNLEEEAQTDEFVPKPKSPEYVPKKTGIDVITQIEDGDLFSFNAEVQPILNVLTWKTLEQALLEVEEESEMEAMQAYKSENKSKKIEEQKSWAHMVREEAEKISQKNQVFQAARTKYVKTMNLISKLQNLNLAKTYLSNLVPSVLNDHTQPSLHADYFPHVLHNHYLPFILEGTVSYLSRKESLKTIPQQIVNDCSSSLIENRAKIVKQHKQKARKEQIRSINFSEKQRLVRFLYINPKFIVQSEFTMRINYTLKGEDYPENLNDSVLLKDSEKKEDSSIIEEKPDKPEWAKYPTFYIDEIKRLSFVIANHPILDTPKDLRKYGFFAEFYAETGELLYSVDSSTTEPHAGVKINANCRDLTKKTSDDEMIILNMSAISKDVHNIFLYSYTARPSPSEFKYARYQLLDFTTYQKLDHKSIKADEFQPDENGVSTPLYLAYRIFRTERNPRSLKIVIQGETPVVENTENDPHWVLEMYNLPIFKSFPDTRAMVQKILVDGWNYNKQLADGLISYRTMKVLQEIEYKKQLEEIEQPGSKKKKKRPVKGKTIEEPVKMTEYIPPTFTYPSKTFGPVLIDLENDKIETLYEKVTKEVDSQLLETFEGELEILIKNKPIKNAYWVRKAHTVQDLRVDKKKHLEPQILATIDAVDS